MITAVANLKGGSGKSTFVFNLALWLNLEKSVGSRKSAQLLDPYSYMKKSAHHQ